MKLVKGEVAVEGKLVEIKARWPLKEISFSKGEVAIWKLLLLLINSVIKLLCSTV